MNPENFKQAWRTQSSQARLTIDADLLLTELRRNQRHFTAMIFWRDVREVGTALLLVLLLLYVGLKSASPWSWYLMVLALVWIAGFMLVDRMRHKRRPPEPGEPLRKSAKTSLAHLEHQIWLLRNVFWWYLLPITLSTLVFFGQGAWQERAGGWWTALAFAGVVLVNVILVSGVYWLNQSVVRSDLEPRRQELQALLVSLKDELPAVST